MKNIYKLLSLLAVLALLLTACATKPQQSDEDRLAGLDISVPGDGDTGGGATGGGGIRGNGVAFGIGDQRGTVTVGGDSVLLRLRCHAGGEQQYGDQQKAD